MLKEYSLKALQTAINQALNLDYAMPEKLAALEGKVLEMVINPLNVHFFIVFEQKIMKLKVDHSTPADSIIHSNPLGLIRLSLLPASKARSLFNDKIHISGDIVLGQQVKQLFDQLDIDWEGHLAHFTGDVIAHQFGSLLRHGWQWSRQFGNSMRDNVTEYLQEEARLVPSKQELEDFFHQVDKTALEVERLAAWIALLSSAPDV